MKSLDNTELYDVDVEVETYLFKIGRMSITILFSKAFKHILFQFYFKPLSATSKSSAFNIIQYRP